MVMAKAFLPHLIYSAPRVHLSTERCQRQSCDYRQRCQVVFPEDGGVRKLCQCTHINCTNKLNPLCGRDGRKYTSVCELQKKECQLGQPIGILHFNECKLNRHLCLGGLRDRESRIYGCVWAKYRRLSASEPTYLCSWKFCIYCFVANMVKYWIIESVDSTDTQS